MKVNFSFPQTLQSHYPGLETIVSFYGEAKPIGERILIIRAFAKVGNGSAQFSFQPLEIPSDFDESVSAEIQFYCIGQMGKFLALCRTAAHEALTNEGYFDPERPDLRKPIMRAEMSDAHNT